MAATARALLSLLPLLLLLARGALSAAVHDSPPEVTDLPNEEVPIWSTHAKLCVKELNLTEDDVSAAMEMDMEGDRIPPFVTCIWGCMYRKVGLLVEGNLPEDAPPVVPEEVLHQYESLKNTCSEQVAAVDDECEKGKILRDCAQSAEATTGPSSSEEEP